MVTEVQNYKSLYEEALAKIAALQSQLDFLKRQMFGQKSERFVDIPSQDEFLPGFELPAEKVEVKTTQIASHERKSIKNKDQFKSKPKV